MTGPQTARDIKVRVIDHQYTYSFADWPNAIVFARKQPGLVHVEQPNQGRFVTYSDGVVTHSKGDVEVTGERLSKAQRKQREIPKDEELRPALAPSEVFVAKRGHVSVGMFLLRCCAETAAGPRGRVGVVYDARAAQELRGNPDYPVCVCNTPLWAAS
jgi:hypothetical protein